MAQNIIVAPDVEMTPTNHALWSAAFPDYDGTFFQFMSRPSAERDRWLQTMTRNVAFDGPLCMPTYS